MMSFFLNARKKLNYFYIDKVYFYCNKLIRPRLNSAHLIKIDLIRSCLHRVIFAASLLIIYSSYSTASQIYIKMGEAKVKKSLLALPKFNYLNSQKTGKNTSLEIELYSTLKNDLEVSTYFQFMAEGAFPERTETKSLKPIDQDPEKGFSYKSWVALNIDFLIRAGFSVIGNEIHLETYLYHIPKASLVFAKKYTGPLEAVRRIAHAYANDILKELTGEEGVFLSKLVVSSDYKSFPYKEIFIMDWDGSNVQKLTNLKTISISPTWSPDGKKVAYTSYVQKKGIRNADMFIQDVESGDRKLISYQPGINSGASFAVDGKSLFLTISKGLNPDIYQINLAGQTLERLTQGPIGAMNVEPAASPDGTKIAFASDRAGKPMIYTMNLDKSNLKRLTLYGQFNASPTWSPDGKKIAFAGQTENNFDIFIMDSNGDNISRLTSARKANGKMANNEDPAFSPDGRFIVFTSDRTGSNQLFMISLDGSEERQITKDHSNYFKPKWSKNL